MKTPSVSRRSWRCAVWIGLGLLIGPTPLAAAEIQLRATCRADGGLVLLEDIAEVLSSDADEAKRLGKIDVAAAPPAGERRFLKAREIQDILAARGVNMAAHRLSGASQVTVTGTLQTKVKAAAAAPRAATSAVGVDPKLVSDQFRKALVEYLEERSAREGDWQIQFNLDPAQTALVNAAGEGLVISGGHEPWTGQQRFHLAANIDGETRRTALAAEVTLPATLVVASRALTRGATIHASDVRLEPGIALRGRAQAYEAIEEVIGKEVTRNVSENQILDSESVRRPIYVRRGEIVTVYARAGGIQVRTTARSRDEGSHNDLVAVESLGDRKEFSARVIGPQEVEVYAHAVSVAAEDGPPGGAARANQVSAAPLAPAPAGAWRTPAAPTPAEKMVSGSRVVARDVKPKPAGANAPRHAWQTRTTGRVTAVVVPRRREEADPSKPASAEK